MILGLQKEQVQTDFVPFFFALKMPYFIVLVEKIYFGIM